MSPETEIVIIGCGAGGGTAAQFARKTDRKSKITVFEKGSYPQYSKCGLPYVISEDISDFHDLIEFSEEWFKKANIDVFLNTNVEKIDTIKQIVHTKNKNSIIEKHYDSLIIATGAKPFIPPIENILENEKPINGVYFLRTIDDAKQISQGVLKGKNATVIGAGYIGLEIAESLHKRGMRVNIVEVLPNILTNILDEDMSSFVFERLKETLNIHLNSLVIKIERTNGGVNKVFIKNNETGNEETINTDVLILASGTTPEILIAKNIGCNIGTTGGIIVNEKSETSVKNVFAVGDCSEFKDFITKQPIRIGLGSITVRQGIAAGVNAAGGEYKLSDGMLQTSTSKFFDLEVAAVGPKRNDIKEMPTISGKINGSSLPNYFPGGKPIKIKIITDEKGKILSAQAVGKNAALRINTFACAILNGMNVETLRKLETAYAPPIAPTLDAITLVCDVIFLKLNRKK